MIKNTILYIITALAFLLVLTYDLADHTVLQTVACAVSVIWLFIFGLANSNRRESVDC